MFKEQNDRNAALNIVSRFHSNTALSAAFEPEFIEDRVLRFASKMLPLTSFSRLSDMVSFMYSECTPDEISSSVLVKIIRSGGESLDAFDLRLPDTERRLVIPFRPFIPYESTARQEPELSKTDMIPFFFFNEDGTFGVNILDDQENFRMLDNVTPLDRESLCRSTLKVKFGWPNYPNAELQIRFAKRSSKTEGKIAVTARRLASRVAGTTRLFMAEANELRMGAVIKYKLGPLFEFPDWRIGTDPGQITYRDVILLGVIFVSPGSIMPILKLHPDFGGRLSSSVTLT